MLVLLNIPLRRDAPALPEGEPFIVNACNLKPLTPGEVAAEGRRRGVSEETGVAAEGRRRGVSEGNRGGCRRQTERGFRGNRGGCRRQTERGFRRKQVWLPKADGEGTNIKLTFR